MVFFTCDGCGETLKKAKVDAHAAKCYQCHSVSCVDCSVSFFGDDYRKHTTCVTEAERYEKTLFRGRKKKTSPQEKWMELIYTAAEDVSAPVDIKPKLGELSMLGDNVPRKEKQFRNFVANCLKMRDKKKVDEVWNFLMKVKEDVNAPVKKSVPVEISDKEDDLDTTDSKVEETKNALPTSEEDKSINNQNPLTKTFTEEGVKKAMKKILKAAPDRSMKLKHLRTKIQEQLGTEDRKGIKRVIEEQLEAKKKFKKEGKHVILVK